MINSILLIKKRRKILYIFICILQILISKPILSNSSNSLSKNIKNQEIKEEFNKHNYLEITSTQWEKLEKNKNSSNIKWEIINKNKIEQIRDKANIDKTTYSDKVELNSLNRSIVFNNKIIGPDISWLVPPGFKWNTRYKYDLSTRGHNRRKKGESFWGWNGGDAVGQFYYQPFSFKDYSLGFNLGMRSVFSSSKSIPGGGTDIGEGLSLGFRSDKKLSDTAGVAFGAEQLVHFNGITDTGRDIYLTASKGWFNNSENKSFPLTVATFGFATGKMAEGNIKGLCSDLFGGSGIEANKNTRLCWSPVFSLARVYNTKFSTFFEYNSKWFLLGSSISPFKEIPIRGTFAVQLSDHIENYKINSFDELKWVFRLSLGF